MTRTKSPQESTPGARRPYEAPQVSETTRFETLALSCGKVDDSCAYEPPGVGAS